MQTPVISMFSELEGNMDNVFTTSMVRKLMHNLVFYATYMVFTGEHLAPPVHSELLISMSNITKGFMGIMIVKSSGFRELNRRGRTSISGSVMCDQMSISSSIMTSREDGVVNSRVRADFVELALLPR